MGNLKGRLERLEGGRKGPSVAVITVQRGETTEEARQKHLVAHPEDAKAEVTIVIKGRGQDPSCVPPPPRPEPQETAKAPGLGPISITR